MQREGQPIYPEPDDFFTNYLLVSCIQTTARKIRKQNVFNLQARKEAQGANAAN
jgi:hypothetical protein